MSLQSDSHLVTLAEPGGGGVRGRVRRHLGDGHWRAGAGAALHVEAVATVGVWL